MQCVSNLRPMLLEPSLKRADFVTSASSYTNNSDVKPSVGQPSVSAFDWGSRTAVDDIILSRNSSKSVSSPSVLGLQLMINPAVRSAQTPPNVMTLSTRLYYDSVQLSNMSPRADDITPLSLVRHDSMDTGMDIAAMKTKKLEVDPNQDAEKAEIDEFLRVHCLRIAQGCRDVPVKELRHIIPILILRCFCMKGEQAQKKVKGLWERAPQGWPADVPYCDPNNAPLRSRSGEPIGTKPKKETLNQMFDFLIREYVAQNVDNSVNRLMDSTVAAKYINGQPSMPSSGHDGHVTSNWPMASSPMRISPPTSCWHQQAIASPPTTSSIARNHHVLHPSLSTYPTLSPPITYTSSQVITMPPLSQISSSQLQATAQQTASRKRPYDDVSRWPVSVSEADSTMRLSGSYDSASSPCSEGGKGSMTDHMPPTVRCRDLEALAAAAATRRSVPCKDTTVPVFSPPSPPSSDASGPPPTISPPLAPSQSAVSPPAHMQPMTKKARLLAAVIPPMSPSQSEASDSNSSSSPVPAVSSTDAQVTNSPPLPPPPPSLRSHPINEQALNDIMIRIADKIKTLEQRQLASDRFGIIYVIKDLLWKMRTLLDISQYLPYLEKLHEMDCTLDAIGMLGVFPDSHFHRWQEFEDKWYIRVCGQTNNKSSTTFEAPTSFAQN